MKIKIKETGEIKELTYTCYYDGVYDGANSFEALIDKCYNKDWRLSRIDEDGYYIMRDMLTFESYLKALKNLEQSCKKAYKYSLNLNFDSQKLFDLLIAKELLSKRAGIPQLIVDAIEKHKKIKGKFTIVYCFKWKGRMIGYNYKVDKKGDVLLFDTKEEAERYKPKEVFINAYYEIIQV